MCVSGFSTLPQPYLGFCLDPDHFIVKFEQTLVGYAEKWQKNVVQNPIYI